MTLIPQIPEFEDTLFFGHFQVERTLFVADGTDIGALEENTDEGKGLLVFIQYHTLDTGSKGAMKAQAKQDGEEGSDHSEVGRIEEV
jgi:hypothetical protein